MKRKRAPEIALSAATKEVAFIAAILRRQNIPYRQALSISRKPIICVPLAYETPLNAVLGAHPDHPLQRVSPQEMQSASDIFWIMLAGAGGILLIAWLRVLFHYYTHR